MTAPEESGQLRIQFHTINEVAGVLRIGRTSVYRLIDTGELAAVRVGGSWRISAEALREYVSGLR
jgi:excisionase family DNA binding protein